MISLSAGSLPAQRLDDLQATFLRTVQHELRSPLTLIHGYAELLSEGSLGPVAPDQQSAVMAIAHHTHELRTLVERITTLLAVKAQIVVATPINLADVLSAVIETQRAKALQAEVKLVVDIASELPLVAGHPYYLQPALECLIENALKFTPAGGQVEVRLAAEPDGVCLSVADTGPGIASDQLALIFNPFYQVDGSSTRAYGGLGLGLAVAKAVIEAYSGQISVESQPGAGSRFTVKLPVLSTSTKDDMETPQERKHRVLIVDDEEVIAVTLQAGLAKLPHCEVITASSGQVALQLFAQQAFDLLLTDYKMPDMDGLTLAEQVRRLYPQTTIMMITAHNSYELQEEAAHISIQHILNKPVQLGQLRQLATSALTGQQ